MDYYLYIKKTRGDTCVMHKAFIEKESPEGATHSMMNRDDLEIKLLNAIKF